VASPGSGTVTIGPRQSFTVTLANVGGGDGQFQFRSGDPRMTVSPSSGSVPAGGTVTVTVADIWGIERAVSVGGVLAGSGRVDYTVVVNP
jgi:hypothetical protein